MTLMAETLSGVIERVTFHNPENGFAVLRVQAAGVRGLVTVVGNLPSAVAGEYVEASGGWVQDREHGQQFKADELRTTPPHTVEGIEKYLGSGLVKGIGPHYARKIVEVNFLGVVNTVVPLLANLCARRRGHIVIVGSMAGLQGLAESPAYSASKAAVRIYGEGLRRLLAPQGVRVTVVVAGFIATPMSASLPFPRPFEWTAERAASRIVRGIGRNEAEIAFPWQLRLAGSTAMLMPLGLRDRLLAFGRAWTGHRM